MPRSPVAPVFWYRENFDTPIGEAFDIEREEFDFVPDEIREKAKDAAK